MSKTSLSVYFIRLELYNRVRVFGKIMRKQLPKQFFRVVCSKKITDMHKELFSSRLLAAQPRLNICTFLPEDAEH